MLASKRYKDDLEKKRQNVETWKTPSNAKQWLTNVKQSNIGNKRWSKLLKNQENNNITVNEAR